MQKQTYIDQCLKNNKIIRWPDNCMPLTFYIAPCRWYKAKGEDYKYKQMVIDALHLWEQASEGKVSFRLVQSLHESQINLDWKRVERTSLGHCYFNFDNQGRLFSAEVQIGLSDGVIHSEYQSEDEVFHTIVHEIGHAIGLQHSPFKEDIMYVPHQYGNTKTSFRDLNTLKWLYRLPYGVDASEIISKYGVQGVRTLDELIYLIEKNKSPSKFEEVKDSIATKEKRDLLEEQTNIADLKKYNLLIQQISLSKTVQKYIKGNQVSNKDDC